MNHICIYWHPPSSLLKHNPFQDSAPSHCIQKELMEGQGNLPCKNNKNVDFNNIPWLCIQIWTLFCLHYNNWLACEVNSNLILINGLKSKQFTSIVLYNKLDCSSLVTCVFGVSPSTTYLVLADIANCKLSLLILQSTFNLICRIHFTHCGC